MWQLQHESLESIILENSLVRPLSGMSSNVLFQVTQSCEKLSTPIFITIKSVSIMNSLVGFQSVQIQKHKSKMFFQFKFFPKFAPAPPDAQLQSGRKSEIINILIMWYSGQLERFYFQKCVI